MKECVEEDYNKQCTFSQQFASHVKQEVNTEHCFTIQ